jgi:parvulin-like peptidyl-prolyl isomerase
LLLLTHGAKLFTNGPRESSILKKDFQMKILISILSFFALPCAVSFAQSPKEKEVLATVGNRKIYLEDFVKKLNDVRTQTTNPPTKQQFLEDLIRYEIGLQEAEKKNLDKDPIVIDRMKQELYKALLEKELAAKIDAIRVTEAEMQAWYKNNPEIRTSHILIELKPGATPEQRAEAKKRGLFIYDEVKKSKRPFEELVKIYTDDSLSKIAGGDIGWQSRITVLPPYYEAALSAKVGEIKGLIDTQFGFHILKMTGRRNYEAANKRQIRASVFDEKRRIIFNEYFDRVKKQYAIKIDASLLQ